MPHVCPTCELELVDHELEHVAVLRCPRCHGTWVTEEGFRLAKDEAEPNAAWMDVELWRDHERFEVHSRERACPSCRQRMATLRYGATDVELDYCVHCHGLWLEDEEFGRLVHALRDELARMPARDLLAATLEEALEIVRGPEPLVLEWQDAARVFDLLKLRLFVDHPKLMGRIRGFLGGNPLP